MDGRVRKSMDTGSDFSPRRSRGKIAPRLRRGGFGPRSGVRLFRSIPDLKLLISGRLLVTNLQMSNP
jgi:hypothetical protein